MSLALYLSRVRSSDLLGGGMRTPVRLTANASTPAAAVATSLTTSAAPSRLSRPSVSQERVTNTRQQPQKMAITRRPRRLTQTATAEIPKTAAEANATEAERFW